MQASSARNGALDGRGQGHWWDLMGKPEPLASESTSCTTSTLRYSTAQNLCWSGRLSAKLLASWLKADLRAVCSPCPRGSPCLRATGILGLSLGLVAPVGVCSVVYVVPAPSLALPPAVKGSALWS